MRKREKIVKIFFSSLGELSIFSCELCAENNNNTLLVDGDDNRCELFTRGSHHSALSSGCE